MIKMCPLKNVIFIQSFKFYVVKKNDSVIIVDTLFLLLRILQYIIHTFYQEHQVEIDKKPSKS